MAVVDAAMGAHAASCESAPLPWHLEAALRNALVRSLEFQIAKWHHTRKSLSGKPMTVVDAAGRKKTAVVDAAVGAHAACGPEQRLTTRP